MRTHSHPDHQDQQRQNGRPFAQAEIGHVPVGVIVSMSIVSMGVPCRTMRMRVPVVVVAVAMAGVSRLTRHPSEEGSLVHPQHVAGGQNDADSGEDRPLEVDFGCALQDEKFADEVVQRRQADAG